LDNILFKNYHIKRYRIYYPVRAGVANLCPPNHVLAEWHMEESLPIFKEYYDSLCNVCEKSSVIARKFGRSLEI